jgi:hypothetical protein
MPKELQPNYKRSKKDEPGVALKKAKTVQDVEQKLKLLEQKEKTTQNTGNAKESKSDDDDEVSDFVKHFSVIKVKSFQVNLIMI